jgi:hypothetical protein
MAELGDGGEEVFAVFERNAEGVADDELMRSLWR